MKNELLTDMLNEISVSGKEERIQNIVDRHMEQYADEIKKDEMGNTICILNPHEDEKIMLSAHADEIGLAVSNITSEGMIQAVARGGIIPSTYPGHQVCIHTAEKILYGVVQAPRAKMKSADLKTADFFIDIGASDENQARAMVKPGDPIVFDSCIRELENGRFSARALDDRLGVFIIMEALRRAKEKNCTKGVYAAATSGEETTKNGAYWCAARIEPDMALIVDVTWTSDYPGTEPANAGKVLLGGGPVLCSSVLVSKQLNRKLELCAKKAEIPYQWEVGERQTCTDADQIHFSGRGIPVALVSIPLRYMHTPGEVADEKDVENCIRLVTEFLINM